VLFDERFVPLYVASISGVALFPLALLISARRFNLFDIDRLISGAVSYTLLMVMLAVFGELVLEPLAARAAGLLGVDPGSGQLLFIMVPAGCQFPRRLGTSMTQPKESPTIPLPVNPCSLPRPKARTSTPM
jgi:hypothetical protein